jgi:hypothetical protein
MVMATPGQARRRRDMLQIDPPYLLTPSTAGGREEKGLRNRIKRSSAFMASLLLSRESRSERSSDAQRTSAPNSRRRLRLSVCTHSSASRPSSS